MVTKMNLLMEKWWTTCVVKRFVLKLIQRLVIRGKTESSASSFGTQLHMSNIFRSFYTGQPISELSIFLTLSSLTERHWSEQYAGHLSTSSFLLRIRASHKEMITTQVWFLVWDLNSPTFPTYVKKTFFHKFFFYRYMIFIILYYWLLYDFLLPQSELYGSNLSLTDSVSPPVITPPPTPVNRFLASVSSSKRNQIHVCIPRYILRGLGRDSYHVFEVKVSVSIK